MKFVTSLVVLLCIVTLALGQGCSPDEFECAFGHCIPVYWICDGEFDCGNLRDEIDPVTGECPFCPDNYFQCTNGLCRDKTIVCDGRNDCGDRSDEPENPDDCPACQDGQFRCNNGKCIPEGWVCDGDNDCVDWSDEAEESCPCEEDEVRCKLKPGEDPRQPGNCIPPEWICDFIWDCAEGSDEKNCTVRAVGQNRHTSVLRSAKKH